MSGFQHAKLGQSASAPELQFRIPLPSTQPEQISTARSTTSLLTHRNVLTDSEAMATRSMVLDEIKALRSGRLRGQGGVGGERASRNSVQERPARPSTSMPRIFSFQSRSPRSEDVAARDRKSLVLKRPATAFELRDSEMENIRRGLDQLRTERDASICRDATLLTRSAQARRKKVWRDAEHTTDAGLKALTTFYEMYKTGYATNYGKNIRGDSAKSARRRQFSRNTRARKNKSNETTKRPDDAQSSSFESKHDTGPSTILSSRAAYIKALDKHGLAPERIHVVRPSDNGSTIVDISNYGLGHKRLMALACSLGARAFEGFKCSGNRLDEVTASTLISALSCDCMTIDLHHNSIGMGGCQALVHTMLLPTRNELLVLCLANNNLGDDCVGELSTGLKKNKTLRRLNLSKNNITEIGAQSLVDALRSSKSLWELDLSWNAVGQVLVGIFEQLRSVQHLNLAHNGLGAVLKHKDKFSPMFVEEAAPALGKNITLLHLDLSGNSFAVNVLSVLAQALRENHSIVGLHLEGEAHGWVDAYGFIKVRKPRIVQFRAASATIPRTVRSGEASPDAHTSSEHKDDGSGRRGRNTRGRAAPPISTATGHVTESLEGWVNQPYTLSRSAPRDMCWVCGGWSEHEISIRIASELKLRTPFKESKSTEILSSRVLARVASAPPTGRRNNSRQYGIRRALTKSLVDIDESTIAKAIQEGTGTTPDVADLPKRASGYGIYVHLSCDNFRPSLLMKSPMKKGDSIAKYSIFRCVPPGPLYFFFSVPKQSLSQSSHGRQRGCSVFISDQFHKQPFHRHLFSFSKLTEIDNVLHNSAFRILLPELLNYMPIATRTSALMCRFAPPRYRRVDANAPVPQFRGGQGAKWRPAVSIFSSRAQDSDAKDFYVNDKFLRRLVRSDWNYSKCDRLVAADFEDTTVGVDAVVESAMDVIGRYAEEFNRLFQLTMVHFVDIADDPFSMKKNGFTNFIKMCGFMSPTSMRVEDTRSYTPHKIIAKPLDTARVDIIFVQINVEDEAEPDDEMTAFMNDENPDNAVNRFELLEAILRIATFRFPCIGHWDDYPDATVLKAFKWDPNERGTQENCKYFAKQADRPHPTTTKISLALAIELTIQEAVANIPKNLNQDQSIFRRKHFYFEHVDDFFKFAETPLLELYQVVGRCPKLKRRNFLVSYDYWRGFFITYTQGLFPESLPWLEARKAFIYSLMPSVLCISAPECAHMSFVDFLEGLCRVALALQKAKADSSRQTSSSKRVKNPNRRSLKAHIAGDWEQVSTPLRAMILEHFGPAFREFPQLRVLKTKCEEFEPI